MDYDQILHLLKLMGILLLIFMVQNQATSGQNSGEPVQDVW